MGDTTIQPAVSPTLLAASTSTDADLSQARNPRKEIAALAKQFNLSVGVARSLYRGIISRDPAATGASLLGQFAQAVSKRTLSQATSENATASNDADTLVQSKPTIKQFLTAEPAANVSGLSQQAFKQVTQNPQAGPVLPPPTPPSKAAGAKAPSLEQTLSRSKIPHLDPNHPNWMAFYTLLRDAWDDHTMDRMIDSHMQEAALQAVQVLSLETEATITETQVQKERNDQVLSAASGAVGVDESVHGEAAQRLLESSAVEDAGGLSMTSAAEKKQHSGPFRDMLREDAISRFAGVRPKGAGARFMDADAKYAQTEALEAANGAGSEKKTKKQIEQYRAPQDAVSQQLQQARVGVANDISRNAPLSPATLQTAILTQATPGTPTEPGHDLSPSRIQRRFLTRAEVGALSPAEQKNYQGMIHAFYGARTSDMTDRVQAIVQEEGRLRSAARLARSEAAEPTARRVPQGTSVETYRANCRLMADALDKKATDLHTEMVQPNETAKQVLQRIAFTNRWSMRSVMQHAKWLKELAHKVGETLEKTSVDIRQGDDTETWGVNHNRQVMHETAYAINRRIHDVYQSVIPFRGDAHQTSGEPLKRNERLDQFKTAPGAKLYNLKWDACEALKAKLDAAPALNPDNKAQATEHAELVRLQAYLKDMHKAAPPQVWEVWRLERLQAKAANLRRDPTKQNEADAADETLRRAMDQATRRVDSKWMSLVMEKHLKARHADLLEEANEKVSAEADSQKKAALILERDGLKPQLAAREAFWQENLGRSKKTVIEQKSHSIAATLGFAPKITYKVGQGVPAVPIPNRGRKAGLDGNVAAVNKAAEVVHARVARGGPARPSPEQGQNIREEVAQAHHAAYTESQQRLERQNHVGLGDETDDWMQAFVEPGVDYNDPHALNQRLKDANEAMGTSLAHWDDSALDTQKPMYNAARGLGDTIKTAFSGTQGLASNLAQESADMAGGLVQDVQGDFSAMYDQIMAMRSRLLPLVAKINPWG